MDKHIKNAIHHLTLSRKTSIRFIRKEIHGMIQGKNIRLRMVREGDLEEILNLKNNLTERGEYGHVSLSSEHNFKKKFMDTGLWDDNAGVLLIMDKNDKLVGEIAYFKGVFYMAGYEVGYQLYRKEDRGKGYMTEALTIFSAYLFALKPIERLEICVSKGNIPSRKVAEKCGFKFEGIKRNAVFNSGSYDDLELLSLLRGECPTFSEVWDRG